MLKLTKQTVSEVVDNFFGLRFRKRPLHCVAFKHSDRYHVCEDQLRNSWRQNFIRKLDSVWSLDLRDPNDLIEYLEDLADCGSCAECSAERWLVYRVASDWHASIRRKMQDRLLDLLQERLDDEKKRRKRADDVRELTEDSLERAERRLRIAEATKKELVDKLEKTERQVQEVEKNFREATMRCESADQKLKNADERSKEAEMKLKKTENTLRETEERLEEERIKSDEAERMVQSALEAAAGCCQRALGRCQNHQTLCPDVKMADAPATKVGLASDQQTQPVSEDHLRIAVEQFELEPASYSPTQPTVYQIQTPEVPEAWSQPPISQNCSQFRVGSFHTPHGTRILESSTPVPCMDGPFQLSCQARDQETIYLPPHAQPQPNCQAVHHIAQVLGTVPQLSIFVASQAETTPTADSDMACNSGQTSDAARVLYESRPLSINIATQVEIIPFLDTCDGTTVPCAQTLQRKKECLLTTTPTFTFEEEGEDLGATFRMLFNPRVHMRAASLRLYSDFFTNDNEVLGLSKLFDTRWHVQQLRCKRRRSIFDEEGIEEAMLEWLFGEHSGCEIK